MSRVSTRDEIVSYLDGYLRIGEIADSSPNGLQVQGRDRVSKLAFAVDASVQTIAAALRSKADMLVVHHGLWWGQHEQIVGNLYQRISRLIRGEMSLYAAHLPLDCHPVVGNNVEMARLFGLEVVGAFARYAGVDIGVVAAAARPAARAAFARTVAAALGVTPDVLAFGPPRVSRVGICSGNGARFAEEAKRVGCDTLVTGESSHSAYHPAREAGINLIFGGHYATETLGLRALDRHLKKRFRVKSRFIPAPTGY